MKAYYPLPVEDRKMQFSELQQSIRHFTIMLTKQLVSLRKTGFILRGVDPETTLKVQDSLIEFGKTMFPVWTLSRWEIEYLGRGFKNNFSKTNY